MLTLPANPRFDPHRDAGADITAAILRADAEPALPPGRAAIIAKRQFGAEVFRGETNVIGERLTEWFFPRSLDSLFGHAPSAKPSNPFGYSWDHGFFTGTPGMTTIFKDINFVGPDIPAAPHHEERGWNVFNWRTGQLILINCGFYNLDTAVFLGSSFCHVYGCEFGTRGPIRAASPYAGHYPLLHQGVKNVQERCRITAKFWHDFSTQKRRLSVDKEVTSVDGNLDFHAYRTDAEGGERDDDNLYMQLNLGRGTRLFLSGGPVSDLPWSGRGSTFCDIRTGDGRLVPESAYVITYPGQPNMALDHTIIALPGVEEPMPTMELRVHGNPATEPWTVEALASPTPARVDFYIGGVFQRPERVAPYCLHGDVAGAPVRQTLGAGVHVIGAKATNKDGIVLIEKTVTVTEGVLTSPARAKLAEVQAKLDELKALLP